MSALSWLFQPMNPAVVRGAKKHFFRSDAVNTDDEQRSGPFSTRRHRHPNRVSQINRRHSEVISHTRYPRNTSIAEPRRPMTREVIRPGRKGPFLFARPNPNRFHCHVCCPRVTSVAAGIASPTGDAFLPEARQPIRSNSRPVRALPPAKMFFHAPF